MTLVLGMDVGGTTSRAVLVDETGAVRGMGHAGGGNPVHDLDSAIAAVRTAAGAALGTTNPDTVAAVVIGMAGGSVRVGGRDVTAALGTQLQALGISAPPQLVSDVTVAFVAGTAAADGSVLVAGTGAVAGSIRGREPVRYVDGHGWLLGDRGSGVWMGRRAVASVLAALDRGGQLSTMDNAVLAALGVRADRAEVFSAVYDGYPAVFAGLAPVVLAIDDPAAHRIVADAAEELLTTATAARDTADEPLVLAGGLLTTENPLAAAVHAGAGRRWPDAEITVAGDGARAAGWLGHQRIAA